MTTIAAAPELREWVSHHCKLRDGIEFKVKDGRGTCLIANTATQPFSAGDVLLEIPLEFVLNESSIKGWLQSSGTESTVIEGLLENDRLACMVFLICLQFNIGIWEGDGAQAWKEYLQFLPDSVGLPTELPEDELGIVRGTSLELILGQKLQKLYQEFHLSFENSGITPQPEGSPSQTSQETTHPTFSDWKRADALYRSRCLELPHLGGCMIPALDMVNHSGGGKHNAFYELRGDKVCLVLGMDLDDGSDSRETETEITINYGDEGKPPLEFLYSYGFIEESVEVAPSVTLSLRPLMDSEEGSDHALKAQWVGSTLVKYERNESDGAIVFSSPLLPFLCVTPQDGFTISQRTPDSATGRDDDSPFVVHWKGTPVESPEAAKLLLESSPQYPLYRSRAIGYAHTMVLGILNVVGVEQVEYYESLPPDYLTPAMSAVFRLRMIEGAFLAEAESVLEVELQKAQAHPVVVEYLNS